MSRCRSLTALPACVNGASSRSSVLFHTSALRPACLAAARSCKRNQKMLVVWTAPGWDHILAGLLKSAVALARAKRALSSSRADISKIKAPGYKGSSEVTEFVMRETSSFLPNPIWGNVTKSKSPRHLNIWSLERSAAAGRAQ